MHPNPPHSKSTPEEFFSTLLVFSKLDLCWRGSYDGRVKWMGRSTLGSGRYQVRARIGRGGQGEIYRASCDVVVKRLIRVRDPQHQQRLKREFEAARRIDHPNVIKVLDGDFGAEPYIVMEYLRGEPLSKRIVRARKANRALDCIPLLLQAMQGVKELHANGLIHRDLKPDNIFVRNDRDLEIAVVLDLGAVRFLTRPKHHGRTTTDVLIGTRGYMAPEQAAGQRAAEPADIYALGVIVYELLVGRLPCDLDGDNGCPDGSSSVAHGLEHAVQRILRLPVWSSGVELGDVRANLVHVVMKAIDPDVDGRYESVAAFAIALERAVGLTESTLVPIDRASAASSHRSVMPTRALPSRVVTPWRASAALIGLVVVVVLAGVAVLVLPARAPVLQADRALAAHERYAQSGGPRVPHSDPSPQPVNARPNPGEKRAAAAVAHAQRPAPLKRAEPIEVRTEPPAEPPADTEEAVWARMKKRIEQSRDDQSR